MEKQGPEQAKLLSKLFDAAEDVNLTSQDLDRELRVAGINSQSLVDDVLKLVNILSSAQATKDAQMPMAASKQEGPQDDIVEFLKKGKKLKD